MSFTESMRGRRNSKFKSEINLVPYIDVMLVLLIIFIAASPMQPPSEIELPNAARSAQPPSEYIRIHLKPDASATLTINGRKDGSVPGEIVANHNEMAQKLGAMHKAHPGMPVMIAADKGIKYDEVIKAISEAKKAGIDRVGLATR